MFRDIGGFDARFRTASEDREFCDRCRFRGHPMAYVPDAIMAHAHHLSLARFCRQHFNYGRGACNIHEVSAQRGSGTVQDAITFHLNAWDWLLHPFAQVGWRRALPMAGLLALWQASNAAGFFGETLHRRLGRHPTPLSIGSSCVSGGYSKMHERRGIIPSLEPGFGGWFLTN